MIPSQHIKVNAIQTALFSPEATNLTSATFWQMAAEGAILTPLFTNPEVQYLIHKGTPTIHILSRINPIPQIDTYLFKIHYNTILPSTPRPS